MAITNVNWNASATTNRTAIQSAVNGGGARLVYDALHPVWDVDVASDPANADASVDPANPSSRKNRQVAIEMVNGSSLILDAGVTLQAAANFFHSIRACLVGVYSDSLGTAVNNVTISGGANSTLKMQIADYAAAAYLFGGVRSEWRHAVEACGVNGLTISDLTILNSGGDGLYIGPDEPYTGGTFPLGTYDPTISVPCSNVNILRCVGDNPTRNGCSIMSCSGLLMDGCTLKNAAILNPRSGLCVEPYHPHQTLLRIEVKNCNFLTNVISGVIVDLSFLDTTQVVGLSVHSSSISGSSGGGINYNNGAVGPKAGSVVDFSDILLDSNVWGVYMTWLYPAQTSLLFRRLVQVNTTTQPFEFLFNGTNPASPGAGGVCFDDCSVEDAVDQALLKISGTNPLAASQRFAGSILWKPTGAFTAAQALTLLPSMLVQRADQRGIAGRRMLYG